MARRKKETTSKSEPKPEVKTFGYVVGKPAAQQEHPNNKNK